MPKSKIFPILDGYSLKFDQRAKGNETPYYVGRILKDNVVVGSFQNSGTGGATIINPPILRDAFIKMFDDTAKKLKRDPSKCFEREAEIINFVNVAGYQKLEKPMMSHWEDWVEQAFSGP